MSRFVKIFTVVILFISAAIQTLEAKPMTAWFVESSSPVNGNLYINMVNTSMDAVLKSSGLFNVVNSAQLQLDLQKYNCISQQCRDSFLKEAGIDLLFTVSVNDEGTTQIINFSANGFSFPYNGVTIYSARKIIDRGKFELTPAELQKVISEYITQMLVETLALYRTPAYIVKETDILVISCDIPVNGKKTVYRKLTAPGDMALYKESGKIEFKNNQPFNFNKDEILEGDFILIDYIAVKDELLKKLYLNKKHDVFTEPTVSDAFATLALASFGSSIMPLLSMGDYYKAADFTGFAFWTLGALPFVGLELAGYIDNPNSYHKQQLEVPHRVRTNYAFAFYYMFSGGAGIFIDARVTPMYEKARSYKDKSYLLGNNLAAGLLSATTAGGGHFYRGWRGWGMTYYLADNLLMYGFLNSMLPVERIDNSGKYINNEIEFKEWAPWCIALFLVKSIEITHVMLIQDNVMSDTSSDSEKKIFINPVVSNSENKMSYGLEIVYAW